MCGPNWAERDMLIGQEAREKVWLQLGMLVKFVLLSQRICISLLGLP